MNKVYITLSSPHSSLFLWSMLSGMTNKPKEMPDYRYTSSSWQSPVKRRRRGARRGKKKKDTTEEPYGIDIRQGAHAPKPFLLERKKNWHKLFQKEITPHQSHPALQCVLRAQKGIIKPASR